MVERAFEWLFVLSLVAPAVAVILSVLLVIWPPHRLHHAHHTSSATSPA
jgi:hypothetical protein